MGKYFWVLLGLSAIALLGIIGFGFAAVFVYAPDRVAWGFSGSLVFFCIGVFGTVIAGMVSESKSNERELCTDCGVFLDLPAARHCENDLHATEADQREA